MCPTWDPGKGTDVLHDHPQLPGSAPQTSSAYQDLGSLRMERTFKVICPNACQRLEFHSVVPTPCLNTWVMANSLPLGAARAESWKVPQESPNLIPSLYRWRQFQNQENSLFQGHPLGQHTISCMSHTPVVISFLRMSHASCLCLLCSPSWNSLPAISPTCVGTHTCLSRSNTGIFPSCLRTSHLREARGFAKDIGYRV